ncbi:MAG: rhomboid family intramembrane serine protease, partial [Bacteroidota bacterium]
MPGLIDQFRYQVRIADTLQRLIGVNVVVFVLLRLTNVISTLFLHPVLDLMTVKTWLAIPSSPLQLITHPWTIITYMFVHWDFMHILFNMLWLYWFCRIMKEFIGSKKLLATYLLGGLAGGLTYVLAYNTLPYFAGQSADSFAIGASASTMAITIATDTLLPDYDL